MSSIKAFRDEWMSADIEQNTSTFGSFDARRQRYTIYWAFYENSAYRDLHKWSHSFKVQYGLYKFIRGIYNPAYRLGEFWKTQLWGGKLDPMAGNDLKTAIPIETNNEKIREHIAKIWKWSNWQVNKDILTLWGSVLGDFALKVIDNPQKSKVYLKVVHPGTIRDIELDDFGNVKYYEIIESRFDPNDPDRIVEYREVAERVENGGVVFSTELNGDYFDWDENGSGGVWAEDYGFIPMVVGQHNNVGLDWGWSEFHPAHEKFREVDDIASKLSDQIRKMVHSPWLLSGVTKPKNELSTSGSSTSTDLNREKEEIPIIYAPIGADAKALVSPLDIQATSEYIKSILKNIEQDFPELSVNLQNFSDDISGRALRINQRPTETKVRNRRPNYDDALCRAQMMALSIGAKRGLFEGISIESYEKGKLDHGVADRPVFDEDKQDELEFEAIFWKTAEQAHKNGVPLPIFLKTHGWDETKINEILNSEEYQSRMNAIRQLSMMNDGSEESSFGNNDQENDDQDNQNF